MIYVQAQNPNESNHTIVRSVHIKRDHRTFCNSKVTKTWVEVDGDNSAIACRLCKRNYISMRDQGLLQ